MRRRISGGFLSWWAFHHLGAGSMTSIRSCCVAFAFFAFGTGSSTAEQPPISGRSTVPLPNGAIARLGDGRLRHPAGLTSMTFFADGSRLACGGADGAIMVWEVSTGNLITVLKGHSSSVTFVASTSNAKSLISGGGDGVRLWDVATWDSTVIAKGGHSRAFCQIDQRRYRGDSR